MTDAADAPCPPGPAEACRKLVSASLMRIGVAVVWRPIPRSAALHVPLDQLPWALQTGVPTFPDERQLTLVVGLPRDASRSTAASVDVAAAILRMVGALLAVTALCLSVEAATNGNDGCIPPASS